MTTNETTAPAPRHYKVRWLIAAGALTATVLGTGALAPAGASADAPRPEATTKASLLVDLPVSASQRGPWTVGVNALPPVTGTVSIAGTPTVNVANLPAAAPAPLWQGTPYVSQHTARSDRECSSFAPIPAGMVLFLERAVSDIVNPGVPPSSVFIVRVTSLGGTRAELFMPADPNGAYKDLYNGTLEIGMPVTTVSACLTTGSAIVQGDITVFGYLVPAP